MLEPYMIGSSLNRHMLPELLQSMQHMPPYVLKDVAQEITWLDASSQVDIMTAGESFNPTLSALIPQVFERYSATKTPFDYTQSTKLMRTVLDFRSRGQIDDEQALAGLRSLVGGYVPETDQTFLPVLADMSASDCRWFENVAELDHLFAKHIATIEPKSFFEQKASKAMVRAYLPQTLGGVAQRMPSPQLTNLVSDIVEQVGIERRFDVIAQAVGDKKLLSVHDSLYGISGSEPLSVEMLKRYPAEKVLTPARAADLQRHMFSKGLPALLTSVLNDVDVLRVPEVSQFIGSNMASIVRNIEGVFALKNLVEVADREGKLQDLINGAVSSGRHMLATTESFDPKTARTEEILEKISNVVWGGRDAKPYAALYYQGALRQFKTLLALTREVSPQELAGGTESKCTKARPAAEAEFSL